MTLKISKTLTLPNDAATSTFGILATKGAGKSNAAVVMAEEMYDRGIQWCAIDPKGDWWGIRSAGSAPGLPIIVFGGRHGDVPLESTAGEFVARLILDQHITCVLDVSQFSKAETTRFLFDFGRYLFAHIDDGAARVLHLFLEEAHEYLPQVVTGDQAKTVNIWQRIVKQGRFKGLGATLISQRSSVLNKDVLELIDSLIVGRTTGPLSRKSIAAWVHDQDVDPQLMASLPGLANGEAWIWSPLFDLIERFKFRKRRTFDSGSTPKVGDLASKRAPKLTPVDLTKIATEMAATIEKVKSEDPKELRRQIADLVRQLNQRPSVETVTMEYEVIVPDAVAMKRIDAALVGLQDELVEVKRWTGAVEKRVIEVGDLLASAIERPVTTPARPSAPITAPKRQSPAPAQRAPRAAATSPGDSALGKPHRAILTVLANYPEGRNVRQLTALTMKTYSGGFRNLLSTLRANAYIEGANTGIIKITDAGLDALGEPDYLPTGTELLDWWLTAPVLGEPHRQILRFLVAQYPERYIGADLAHAIGKEYSGGFRNLLSKLRTLDLIEGSNVDGVTVNQEFWESVHG